MQFIPWDQILSCPTVQRSKDGITTYQISPDAIIWVTDSQKMLAQTKANGHPLCLVMASDEGEAQVYRIIDFQ